jgi:hypothetical protein
MTEPTRRRPAAISGSKTNRLGSPSVFRALVTGPGAVGQGAQALRLRRTHKVALLASAHMSPKTSGPLNPHSPIITSCTLTFGFRHAATPLLHQRGETVHGRH